MADNSKNNSVKKERTEEDLALKIIEVLKGSSFKKASVSIEIARNLIREKSILL